MDTQNVIIANAHSGESEIKKPLEAIKKNCEELAQIKPGNTNEMVAKLQEMILNYYRDARRQAQQSFYSALAAATIGILFFVYAAWLNMQSHDTSSKISWIAGALIQVISGINFFLYSKASRQFSSFHICLERTNRFLLANTLCDNIGCTIKRDSTRQEIIETILTAPMLTLDVISKGESKSPSHKPKSQTEKADLNHEPSLS